MIWLDTRTKIVSTEEAARIAAAGATVVSGYFDPLVASHAGRLAELKREGAPLLVLIATPEHAILPARARAELVAALRVVDFVAESCRVARDYQLEQEDMNRLAGLIERVHARQNGAS
jgi:glycerol-3-phosphate cytidylyltransferase-like family protein